MSALPNFLRNLSITVATSMAFAAAGCSSSDSKADPDKNETPAPVAGPTLPTAQGTCPAMTDGDQLFLGKNVKLHVPADGAPTGGPLVIYWHGTGSNTNECALTMGSTLDDILAQGGVVACMDGGQSAGDGDYTGPFEWSDGDYKVADEVVACATEKFKTDTKRIHTLGMSAGGLQTSQMVLRRGYIASAVSLSGGCIDCGEPADPDNKTPVMFFHGSWEADVVVIHFYDTSRNMENVLLDRGQFVIDCNHNQGHIVPPTSASWWQFFQDHPYEKTPEAYANGLPAGFPDYCQIVTTPWPPPNGGM